MEINRKIESEKTMQLLNTRKPVYLFLKKEYNILHGLAVNNIYVQNNVNNKIL